jgi:hypothetical protein
LDLADGSRSRNRQFGREADHNTPVSQQLAALPNMLTLPVPLTELFSRINRGDFVGLLAKSGAYWRINAVTLVDEGAPAFGGSCRSEFLPLIKSLPSQPPICNVFAKLRVKSLGKLHLRVVEPRRGAYPAVIAPAATRPSDASHKTARPNA